MVAQKGIVLTPALVRCGVCRLDAERWGVLFVAFFDDGNRLPLLRM